ncbi:hypothetical protein FGG08_002513 [Glutinoglossum americanum]|uniref:Uncharacterized protein n=1 Tax=Glutinoglossum americanum TaxID=1670608 RepID=A0A9P8L4F5_9PEZI|nr:hypothetical protein FGG08_002513 [Glutinoglossum americanum]
MVRTPTDDPLDGKLSGTTLSRELGCAIFNAFWQRDHEPTAYDKLNLEAYFAYCKEECKTLRSDITATITHRDLTVVVSHLRHDENTKPAIYDKLKALPHLQVISDGRDQLIKDIVTLATHLWLMTNVGSMGSSIAIGQNTSSCPTFWRDDERLKDFINRKLPENTAVSGVTQLPKSFNAANIEQIAGITIFWTSDLADHLSMTEDYTKVAIFHHASFLRCHQKWNCSNHNDDSGFLKPELVDETLRTLALLFPEYDRNLSKWYRRQNTQNPLDYTAIECGPLNSEQRQIENFKYWRHRLIILKQVFDDSEPKTVSQLWRDDQTLDQRRDLERMPLNDAATYNASMKRYRSQSLQRTWYGAAVVVPAALT